MRLISVHQLDSHMILARSIYYQDTLILKEGCGALERFKNKLLNLEIHYVYVQDDISEDIDVPDIVDHNTRQICKLMLQNTIRRYITTNTLDLTELTDSIATLMDQILDNRDVMISLKEICSKDESTFIHCISTTIYSLLLATELGYSKEMLQKLAMGTLLHDIGKLMLDATIIFKDGKLSDEEFEYVKTHTTLGYHALQSCSSLTELSRVIALSHHEKLDGSGYPQQLTSKDIHPFIRIVTIADVYDALTSDRCYRKHWTAKQALDHLIEYSGKLYDTEYLRIFMQHISIYPNGSIVRLSNHILGIVKLQNKHLPERPIIRVIATNDGHRIDPYEIDLCKELDVTIIESELDISLIP